MPGDSRVLATLYISMIDFVVNINSTALSWLFKTTTCSTDSFKHQVAGSCTTNDLAMIGILSTVAAGVSFTYFVVLTGFRKSTCETLSFNDSAVDGVLAAFVLYVSVRIYAYQQLHWQMVQFSLIIVAYALARGLYKKHVVGKTFQKVDLTGKVFIVTGSNAGIGFETARQIVLMNGTVVMACRSLDKGNEARESIIRDTQCAPSKLVLLKLDLCDFESVRQFVKDFKRLALPLHCLVNNAGVMIQERQVTKGGLETVFTANHLSHFLLTNLLLPLIEETGGRIVNVSSSTHHIVKQFNFDDVMSEKYYELFNTYAQSKLANILFTRELQSRLTAEGSDVRVFCLHPGLVRTEVTRNMSDFMQVGNRLAAPIMMTLQKTPAEGAYCSVHVATAPELSARPGGEYFLHCEPAPVSEGALREEDGERLWELSVELTGL